MWVCAMAIFDMCLCANQLSERGMTCILSFGFGKCLFTWSLDCNHLSVLPGEGWYICCLLKVRLMARLLFLKPCFHETQERVELVEWFRSVYCFTGEGFWLYCTGVMGITCILKSTLLKRDSSRATSRSGREPTKARLDNFVGINTLWIAKTRPWATMGGKREGNSRSK